MQRLASSVGNAGSTVAIDVVAVTRVEARSAATVAGVAIARG